MSDSTEAPSRIRRNLLASLLCAALAACTNQVGVAPTSEGEGGTAMTETDFSSFPDMPLPVGGKIVLDRTLIFGSGETWFGRLVINTSHSADDIFDFYMRELPGYGWSEVTSMRSEVSIITHSRRDRIATIQIQSATLRGSRITINVSPRGSPAEALRAPAAPPAEQRAQ